MSSFVLNFLKNITLVSTIVLAFNFQFIWSFGGVILYTIFQEVERMAGKK